MPSLTIGSERDTDREERSHSFVDAETDLAAPQLHVRAQQLRRVALRMESFLKEQLERLESSMPQDLGGVDPSEFSPMVEDFEALRASWESERQEQIRQLRDEAQRLDEAWQRLEAEQRQVMARQAAMKSVGACAPTASADGVRPVGPLHPVTGGRPAGGGQAGPRLVETAGSSASHHAQIQFQQLRREMQRHANQQKKNS